MQVCAYLYVVICIYVFTWVLICIDTSFCMSVYMSVIEYICAFSVINISFGD